MDAKERLLNDLKGIVTGKRVANAYLLTGGTAEDRMELGEAFARMLVTTEADIIRPEIEKKDQKTLLFSVGDVRRGITDTVYVRPYGDGKKVYLLDKAALNLPENMNCDCDEFHTNIPEEFIEAWRKLKGIEDGA